MKIIVGVDESGRGPAIGPLVICAYANFEHNLAVLKQNGVKDSKLVTPTNRQRLANELKKGIYVLRSISAVEITQVMEKNISLNEFEAKIIGELLTELATTTDFYRVYVDSPDPEPTKFARRIKKYYAGNAEIISENKADVNYPVVSAASIIAKVERDAEIERIKEIVGEDFNSGYSSDPFTIEFLKRRHNDEIVQEFMRHEWKTIKNLKSKQTALDEFSL